MAIEYSPRKNRVDSAPAQAPTIPVVDQQEEISQLRRKLEAARPYLPESARSLIDELGDEKVIFIPRAVGCSVNLGSEVTREGNSVGRINLRTTTEPKYRGAVSVTYSWNGHHGPDEELLGAFIEPIYCPDGWVHYPAHEYARLGQNDIEVGEFGERVREIVAKPIYQGFKEIKIEVFTYESSAIVITYGHTTHLTRSEQVVKPGILGGKQS